MVETSLGMVKILVNTNACDWHGMSGESLWGLRLHGDFFRIENIPLYAYGISYHDIIHACHCGTGLEFKSITMRGGHSTYRVLLKSDRTKAEFLARWVLLEHLGCSYESSMNPEDVFAIDVPPEVDVHIVFRILEKGEADGVWHLDEGNFEHEQNA